MGEGCDKQRVKIRVYPHKTRGGWGTRCPRVVEPWRHTESVTDLFQPAAGIWPCSRQRFSFLPAQADFCAASPFFLANCACSQLSLEIQNDYRWMDSLIFVLFSYSNWLCEGWILPGHTQIFYWCFQIACSSQRLWTILQSAEPTCPGSTWKKANLCMPSLSHTINICLHLPFTTEKVFILWNYTTILVPLWFSTVNVQMYKAMPQCGQSWKEIWMSN